MSGELCNIGDSLSFTNCETWSLRGATYNDNREVIWLCKYYEPFNVIDESDSKTRQKLWLNCEAYFGRKLMCTWYKQSRRGVPEGEVTGHLIGETEHGRK